MVKLTLENWPFLICKSFNQVKKLTSSLPFGILLAFDLWSCWEKKKKKKIRLVINSSIRLFRTRISELTRELGNLINITFTGNVLILHNNLKLPTAQTRPIKSHLFWNYFLLVIRGDARKECQTNQSYVTLKKTRKNHTIGLKRVGKVFMCFALQSGSSSLTTCIMQVNIV